MLGNVAFILKHIIDMCMSGNECNLMATHDLEKVVCICDLGIVFKPFAERTMLRDIKICAHRDICHESLDESEHMIGIAFLIFTLCVVDDVVEGIDSLWVGECKCEHPFVEAYTICSHIGEFDEHFVPSFFQL